MVSVPPSVGLAIVTHDSEAVLSGCLDHWAASTRRPDHVVVVDSGSADPVGVKRLAAVSALAADVEVTVVVAGSNIGFCAANNRALESLGPVDVVVFANPDAFVEPDFLQGAIDALAADAHIGLLQPTLVAATPDGSPTGMVDSNGISLRWYGRAVDLDQGGADPGPQPAALRDVDAACGAALVARGVALRSVARHGQVFDESLFMFKEDLDLSLRVRRQGWRVVHAPHLRVRHARGNPQSVRAAIPASVRRRSLRNDWYLWRKGVVPLRVRVPMTGYLLAKTVLVALGR